MALENDITSVELDTDIEAAAAALDHPRAEPKFTLGANRFHVHRAKAQDRQSRRGIKQLIRPENAQAVLAHLPDHPAERTHCILRGDFVLCDLIPAIIQASGPCGHLRIATLGLSVANADTLACLVERGFVDQLTLVVSHYFQQVDKATVFRAVENRLRGLARLVITRCHAKVICLPLETGDTYVIEGSANLRSSDNLEQIAITNDPDTHDFHVSWIDELSGSLPPPNADQQEATSEQGRQEQDVAESDGIAHRLGKSLSEPTAASSEKS